MIDYRCFHNSDPPQIAQLWNQSELGRGAVSGSIPHDWETVVYSQSFFDPRGMILACHDGRIVGMVHAGFGCNESESQLLYSDGVVCVVVVHPEYRRQGIGRELMRRAEEYLAAAGATQFYAGSSFPRDPYYFGLYGGCQPSGFLTSDPAAAPFMEALKYQPAERHIIYHRSNVREQDPVTFRIVSLRRKYGIVVSHQPPDASWWWTCRYGRVDSLRFDLVPLKMGQPDLSGEPVASATIVGLDLYAHKWGERAIGVTEFSVNKAERRRGLGQHLTVEICRRLREEQVGYVEGHVTADNEAIISMLMSSGFQTIDEGVVYQRQG